METLPAVVREPSPTLAEGARPVPESRMLPPHQTKLDRVTGHLAALSADLREWTELRVDLVKRQVEGVQAQIERFQHYLAAAEFFVPAAMLALTAVFFVFLTIAFGLGALLDSLWGGFAITTGLLLVGAGALGWLGMKSVRDAQHQAAEARKKERDAQDRDRSDIQATQAASARNAAS